MPRQDVVIDAADGPCRTAVFTPAEGSGPWPAVIFYMDGMGVRPAMYEMGQRLADAGYLVLLPDLFYRLGPYEPLDAAAVFATGNPREAIGKFLASTDAQRAAADTAALFEYLDTRDDVAGDRVGTTGYCMGGGVSLTVAGTYPERVAVSASFHGGGLASDSEMSPHLLVDKIQGHVYVGAADADGSYPPAMAGRLCEALMAAGVDFRHDLYRGARHGWTMPDFPVYDADAAERHWRELVGAFDAHLRTN